MNTLHRGLQLYRESQPEGTSSILEFGVYRGDSLRKIATYVKDHEMEHVIVCGFDSFEGLPEDWPGTVCKKGHFSTGGEIPMIPHTAIYPGWFEDTIPQYLQDFPEISIGLLHLDADLYSSTITILRGLDHLIVPGTIIVCDEWTYNFVQQKDDQEQRAFNEWVAECGRVVQRIDFVDNEGADIPGVVFPVGWERALFVVTT